MFGLDDIMGGVDDFLTGGAGSAAQDAYKQSRQQLQFIDPEAGASAYASADPATRAAQLEALGQLHNKYTQGGMDAIDRGRVGDIQQGVAQSARATQAGVQQDAMRRGLYNSGNALVSQQVAGQNAGQIGQQQARDAAALSEQSRLGELGQAGGLAGDIRGQDYQKAGALDAISRFNAAQRLNKGNSIAGTYSGEAGVDEENAQRRAGMAKDLARGAGAGI